MTDLTLDDAPSVASGLRGRRRPKVALTLAPAVLARAKAKAKLEGAALSRVVEAALETWIETAGKTEAAGTISQTPDNTTEEPSF